jgi:hypothetical protein
MKQRGIRENRSHESPDSVTLHPGYSLGRVRAWLRFDRKLKPILPFLVDKNRIILSFIEPIQ